MDIEVVGHIPFDPTVTDAMVNGEPVTAYRPDSPSALAMVQTWQTVAARLDQIKE